MSKPKRSRPRDRDQKAHAIHWQNREGAWRVEVQASESASRETCQHEL